MVAQDPLLPLRLVTEVSSIAWNAKRVMSRRLVNAFGVDLRLEDPST